MKSAVSCQGKRGHSEDDDEDLEDYSAEDDSQVVKRRHGKRHHYEMGEGGMLRGSSRTNCKGHWSKEEVSIVDFS